jgi:hypothetical protein
MGGRDLLGLLAVCGGPGQLTAAVARSLVKVATKPISLGPQLRHRKLLEVVADGDVDGQGLATGSGQGLG